MFDTDDVKTLLKKLKELDSQAEMLKEKRDTLNAEAKKWAERRDALNLKKSEVWNELRMHRDKRDETNKAVKKLKEHRSENIAQLNSKREECVALREKVEKFLGRTSQSARSVKRLINKLDWEIQTKPLSPAEENEIIDQIRLLEKQSLIHKEVATLRERLTELRAEFGALRIKSNEVHRQITELADSSQEHHKRMLDKIDEAKHLKGEADDAHRKYLEFKEEESKTHGKYLETIDQIRRVNANIKEIEGAEYNRRLEKEAEMVSEAAYKKLKDRKRLTLDEFKILKEKRLI